MRKASELNRAQRSGYTLVEMLFIFVIVSVLLTVSATVLRVVFFTYQTSAKSVSGSNRIMRLAEAFRADCKNATSMAIDNDEATIQLDGVDRSSSYIFKSGTVVCKQKRNDETTHHETYLLPGYETAISTSTVGMSELITLEFHLTHRTAANQQRLAFRITGTVGGSAP